MPQPYNPDAPEQYVAFDSDNRVWTGETWVVDQSLGLLMTLDDAEAILPIGGFNTNLLHVGNHPMLRKLYFTD